LNPEDIRNIAIAIGVMISGVALLKAAVEYTRQSAQDRADKFQELRAIYKNNKDIRYLEKLLEEDSDELMEIDFSKKLELLGFYEDLALMYKSGVIKKHVCHYMFSYYAIRCWDSEKFWTDANRDSPYWALFRWFALEMKDIENDFKFSHRKYKL
jgi:hypothetical protein